MGTLLMRGITEVIIADHLEKKLKSGKKLRIKYGIDPTGDLIHLGHAVALWKLKEFQDLGHTIVLLIGDITARIGDPSGRSKERKILSDEQIKQNMKNYLDQASKILNLSKTEVRYNSEWFGSFTMKDIMELASRVTFTQVSHRAEFKKRIAAGGDVSLLELFYPVFQGYDSVMLKADMELGGTDQKFNMLMGRQLQTVYAQEPQDVILVPILEGIDGKEKMSKSIGNIVALTEAPESMYGKIMSIPDVILWKYFECASRVPMEEIAVMKKEVAKGSLNPRDAKMRLAHEIVTLYHGSDMAELARNHFISVFQKKERPEHIPEVRLTQKSLPLIDILVTSKLASSKTEARRLIQQKAIKVDDTIQEDCDAHCVLTTKGITIQKGKRHFVKIVKK
ncbi:MAG: tyrosine--tRNA ligase [bacterium]|nr:tyrosine--tRNA ligase [bacterium]